MGPSAKSLLATLVVTLLLAPAAAHAAYPGSNGKIAFVRDGQIWTIEPGGTGAAQLTTGASPSADPEWSPDGSKILYERGSPPELRVMNADGTGDTHVYGPGTYGVHSPTWSPDGGRIAFIQPAFAGPGHFVHQLYTADPDGSHLRLDYVSPDSATIQDLEWSPRGDELAFTQTGSSKEAIVKTVASQNMRSLTVDSDESTSTPAWSPDATRLAFLSDLGFPSVYDVWKTNTNGTGRTQLTSTDVHEYGAEWAPDGTKLVFSGEEPGCSSDCNANLYLMNPDGSGRVGLVVTSGTSETDPDWQPVISTPPPPGYPRPKGASPVRVSLVPAYAQCTTANSAHGAPLVFPSCGPPSEISPTLTVGTPDANGAPANMTGSVQLTTMVGNPTTPANEADVSYTVTIEDVRCRIGLAQDPCGNSNAQGGSDYSGRLDVRLPLRITDRYNLPAPNGNQPGTGDTTADLFVNCIITPNTGFGSICSGSGSIGALYPGAIREGRRALFELGQVEVLDGGPAGDGTDAAPFLKQGIFIP